MTVNVKRLVTLAALVSVGMILSYVESLIPVFIPVPGLKIGLANIATVMCLLLFGFRAAFSVSLLRVCLSSLLFGNSVSFVYSLFGAVFSILVMAGLKRVRFFSGVGISVGGAVFHNLGQILAAAIVMGTSAVAVYLPPLTVGGVLAGIVIGVAAGLLSSRLKGALKL